MNPVLPNMWPAVPEIFVLSMACLILIADLFFTERTRVVSYVLTLLTLVGGAWLALQTMPAEPVFAFNRMFIADPMAAILKVAVFGVTFVVFVYSRQYLSDRAMFRGEYFVLGLFAVLGMLVMISASHFLTLYLGLELLSLCLYAMIALQRDSVPATEAAMKYFVLGAMASGLLLYGLSMIYGMTGSLDIGVVRVALAKIAATDVVLLFGLVFVVVGIAFKLGAVPFHMWVPDVYHGAPTAVTLFVGTAPKIAAFAMVMRLLVGGFDHLAVSWQDMLIIIAILSMGFGNVAAIAQSNIKRMLAYSSISHMGFFTLGILSATPAGYSAAMFYVLSYAVMSLGAFGMVVLLSRAGFEAERIEDFRGLNQRNPWYAFLMLLLMFSMAGVPPTLGFFAKWMAIQSVINTGMLWLAVVAVLFAVIGAFYYLRVVKVMYFDEATDTTPIIARGDMRVLIGINALGLVLAMPWVGALMDLCAKAVRQLP